MTTLSDAARAVVEAQALLNVPHEWASDDRRTVVVNAIHLDGLMDAVDELYRALAQPAPTEPGCGVPECTFATTSHYHAPNGGIKAIYPDEEPALEHDWITDEHHDYQWCRNCLRVRQRNGSTDAKPCRRVRVTLRAAQPAPTGLREAAEAVEAEVIRGKKSGDWIVPVGCQKAFNAAIDALRAALATGSAGEPAGLGAAWREAEAALPPSLGWFEVWRRDEEFLDGPEALYWAAAHGGTSAGWLYWEESGPTPEAALRSLAARLREEGRGS